MQNSKFVLCKRVCFAAYGSKHLTMVACCGAVGSISLRSLCWLSDPPLSPPECWDTSMCHWPGLGYSNKNSIQLTVYIYLNTYKRYVDCKVSLLRIWYNVAQL